MAMKKSRIPNLPSETVMGESACVHSAQSHAIHSRGEDAAVRTVLATPATTPLPANQRRSQAGGAEEDPETCRQAHEWALIRAVKIAYLNLNLNFKIEREKISLSFFPFTLEFQ